MEKIKWCKNQKHGLKICAPNSDVAMGYLKMAEDSFGTMNREKGKNIIFSVSAGYYSLYYSLYSVMRKIGVKSEIHTCSIAFMKYFLKDFYSPEDVNLIEVSFELRNTLQYYVGKNVNKRDLDILWRSAYDFFVKTREILVTLNENEINEIRRRLDG